MVYDDWMNWKLRIEISGAEEHVGHKSRPFVGKFLAMTLARQCFENSPYRLFLAITSIEAVQCLSVRADFHQPCLGR